MPKKIYLEQFIKTIERTFADGSLEKLTLSKSRPNPTLGISLKNVFVRPIELKSGKVLSFTFRYATRDEVKNHPLAAACTLISELLVTQFMEANLITSTEETALRISKKGKIGIFTKKTSKLEAKPSLESPVAIRPNPSTKGHDRQKMRLLDENEPWLVDLGIASKDGHILASAQDKWRQINKYLEVVDGLLGEHALSPTDCRIADMGSGKGYLTFALFVFLKKKKGITGLHLTGVELRPQLVEFCNSVANKYHLNGLNFVAEDIANFAEAKVDVLIALHACDTATDLALWQGLKRKAGIMLLAPCCHKQVRRDMTPPTDSALAPMLGHGILLERQAEMLTDSIRSLILEAEGYRTKVFEFVSAEHTAKNLMITATKRRIVPKNHRENSLAQVARLKTEYGLKKHHLEELLER